MIVRQEADVKFSEYREMQESHDKFYTEGFQMIERVRAVSIINRRL